MILNAVVEGQSHPIEVPDRLLQEAEPFFAKMDSDMDAGWQMGRDWIANPDRVHRCQIAAERLLSALHKNNQALASMMAGYILSRAPEVTEVHIDSTGEPLGTEFVMGGGPFGG